MGGELTWLLVAVTMGVVVGVAVVTGWWGAGLGGEGRAMGMTSACCIVGSILENYALTNHKLKDGYLGSDELLDWLCALGFLRHRQASIYPFHSEIRQRLS